MAAAPGPDAKQRGCHAWAVDVWTRLRRFLVLGSEGGSYYASEWKLTRENATAVEQAVREDGLRAVAEITAVSSDGRAPKNDPALYALALAAGVGDDDTRKAALAALPQVARTGTHLFQFASFVEGFRGWGRSLRRAVAHWYTGQPAEALAYQAVKYRQRAGVTHRDLLRLSHPAIRVGAGNPTVDVTDEHARLFEWIVRGGDTAGLPRVVEGFARAQSAATPAEAASLVREYRLPRVALQPEHLTAPEVWDALLDDMPMTALTRNLATMTRIGVVAPGSDGTARHELSHNCATPTASGAPASTRSQSWPHCERTQRVTARAVVARGRRCDRSSTRWTTRSTRRSATSSRQERDCCSRSTCRAR